MRTQVYDKLVRLGPAYTESASTAEAVQVYVEGTEQLEGYFGAYVPQLFYAVLAPLTLFACLAPLCLPAAVALLLCVPLIQASIVAVQKIAKRVMGEYWGAEGPCCGLSRYRCLRNPRLSARQGLRG